MYIAQKDRKDQRLVRQAAVLARGGEIRNQALAQVKQTAHGGHQVRIQPGHGRGLPRFPGVQREARKEQAVLQPAQKQLSARPRAGKAPDIRPEEEKAGQGHGHGLFVVPAQLGKVGHIVARPGRCGPLGPGDGAA